MTLAIIDIEMTVDPELYSMIVSVLPDTTLDSSMFIATLLAAVSLSVLYWRLVYIHTWHCFDVVGWMHGHHLGIDSYTILKIRVQVLWQLDQRQRRLAIWIKVLLERIWPKVYVAFVEICHLHLSDGLKQD
jgi:hypothetical protein